jgi:hypothetical protein
LLIYKNAGQCNELGKQFKPGVYGTVSLPFF